MNANGFILAELRFMTTIIGLLPAAFIPSVLISRQQASFLVFPFSLKDFSNGRCLCAGVSICEIQ